MQRNQTRSSLRRSKAIKMVKQKIEILDKPVIQLVLPHILKQIFGGNIRYIFTGGAKLKGNVKKFYIENDILICEGYDVRKLHL